MLMSESCNIDQANDANLMEFPCLSLAVAVLSIDVDKSDARTKQIRSTYTVPIQI
jgi:hypothetical protein